MAWPISSVVPGYAGGGLLGQLVGAAAGGAIMGAVSSAVDNGSPISGALVGSVSGMLSTVRVMIRNLTAFIGYNRPMYGTVPVFIGPSYATHCFSYPAGGE